MPRVQKTSVLLLDSGGYEHSHAVRYSNDGAPAWTFDDFRAVCGLALHDYVFRFDYFWCDQNDTETAQDFTARLLGELFDGHEFISVDRLIPVLHLHAHENEIKRLSEDEIVSLVEQVATACQSPFIAIPERELGDGLLARFRLAQRICDTLANQRNAIGLQSWVVEICFPLPISRSLASGWWMALSGIARS
jgi:hypothetical protein